MSTLRLPAKKAPSALPVPAPQPAPATATPPERTPEEKAERARAQAELERKEHLDAVQRRQRRVREARAEFRRRWPAAFTTPVPLAIGMDKVIRAEMPEMTTSRLKEALGPWTHSTVYLRAIAAGVERINLDGTPAGVPDEEQREQAAEELRKRGKWPVEETQDATNLVMSYQRPLTVTFRKQGWALPRPAKGLRPLDTHSLGIGSKD